MKTLTIGRVAILMEIPKIMCLFYIRLQIMNNYKGPVLFVLGNLEGGMLYSNDFDKNGTLLIHFGHVENHIITPVSFGDSRFYLVAPILGGLVNNQTNIMDDKVKIHGSFFSIQG